MTQTPYEKMCHTCGETLPADMLAPSTQPVEDEVERVARAIQDEANRMALAGVDRTDQWYDGLGRAAVATMGGLTHEQLRRALMKIGFLPEEAQRLAPPLLAVLADGAGEGERDA